MIREREYSALPGLAMAVLLLVVLGVLIYLLIDGAEGGYAQATMALKQA